MAKKDDVKGLKELVVEQLQLPKDTMLGAVLVRAVGNHELYIENFRSILEYTDQHLKLQTKNCKLCIEGKKLHIVYYNCEEMKVTGVIKSIRYE